MQAVVTLKEALELMRSGEPFDLVWITADRQRQRGGEILTAKGAQQPLKRKPKGSSAKEDGCTAQRPGDSPGGGSLHSRNPNHYAHGTRNIRLATGKIRKVHIQLIDSINGMKVV